MKIKNASALLRVSLLELVLLLVKLKASNTNSNINCSCTLMLIVIHYDTHTGCHYDSYSNYYAVIVILGSSPRAQAKVDFSVRLLVFHFVRGLGFLFLCSF